MLALLQAASHDQMSLNMATHWLNMSIYTDMCSHCMDTSRQKHMWTCLDTY